MASPSEIGHAVNLASANAGIILATELGASFNPANPVLLIPAQQATYDAAFSAQQKVNTDLAPYSIAVDARQLVFEPLDKWLTRFRANYATAPGVDEKIMEDLATLIRKIKGVEKYKPKKKVTPTEPTDGNTPVEPIVVDKPHSNVHSGFDQVTNSMFEFSALIKNTPGGYLTNVDEFKQLDIDDWIAQMLASTAAVAAAAAPVAISRTDRNQKMYFIPNALVTVGKLNQLILVQPPIASQLKTIFIKIMIGIMSHSILKTMPKTLLVPVITVGNMV